MNSTLSFRSVFLLGCTLLTLTAHENRTRSVVHSSIDACVTNVRKAADALVREGFLLPEDAREEVRKAQSSTVLH